MSASLILAGVQTADQIGVQISNLIDSTGCGATCRTASDVANTEELLNNIVSENYWAIPAPRPASAQTAALKYIDAIIAWTVQQCSNPALGDAGYRCVQERTGNGCPPNCPSNCGNGSQCCCNPIITVRDPIANDTAIYDDSANPVGLQSSMGPNIVPTAQVITNGAGGIIQSGSAQVPPTAGPLGPGSVQSVSTISGAAAGGGVSFGVVVAVVGALLFLILWRKGDL